VIGGLDDTSPGLALRNPPGREELLNVEDWAEIGTGLLEVAPSPSTVGNPIETSASRAGSKLRDKIISAMDSH